MRKKDPANIIIRVSTEILTYLRHKGRFGESYNDVLRRILITKGKEDESTNRGKTPR